MKRLVAVLILVVAANVSLAGIASAQQSGQPDLKMVGQQIKSGADRVSNGAQQIGEGVRLSAIMTWNAVRQGAASFAAVFKGSNDQSMQQSH
jgi:predicted small secreted protein